MQRFSLFLLAATLAAQISFEDIRKSPNHNWLTYAGDYQGHGLSPLTQITPDNVQNMAPKWTFKVPLAKSLRARPIVADGVMYYTNTNSIFALDARSGRPIWQYIDTQAKKESVNRGAAILGNQVYFVTSDCYLVSLDRRTGGLAFRKQYANIKDGVFCTAAPVAINGKIIVGSAGGDEGMRGFLAALDPATGAELWRTFTIPVRGEPGSETWGNFIEYGGAATWLSGTFDPDTNTLYWTTGNPWPDFYGGDRKGDNLYSCSLLAIDASTGKMKWYFQFTPGDWHDWDAQSWPILANVTYEGKPRKVIFHANRNGFLYLLDRETGKYLRSAKLIENLDWASGIDPNGVPNYLLEVDNQLVVPVGKKIRFLTTAGDVIHAWWVPALGWKRDAIPGYINESWAEIQTAGTYRGQCAELCGKDHGFMPIVVDALSAEDYAAWVTKMKAATQHAQSGARAPAAVVAQQ